MRSVHELRAQGWFVGDGLDVATCEIDHVLVGPAGVLAVQVMSSVERDPRGRADIRARIAARQLRHLLAQKELPVDVVPAVLACGPGQPDVPGGVRVVDDVAYLFEDSAAAWLDHLCSRVLLDERLVDGVRDVVAAMLELSHADA